MNSNYNLPINIGNPHEITIKQAAEIIKKLIPESNSVIQYRDLPSDDPMQRKPDITKAQTILGWNPTVDLQDGLLETIQYFKNHLATNN
jgi:dTDP-glucose 4,6-dehydratase